ncbi:MAG: tRNA pseudouridine(13) synthase TruD [Candidatus Nanoarchaeia archaeon]
MKIKEKPEDFIVNELIDLEFAEGDYTYVKVRKINLNTLDVVRFFLRQLRIPRNAISYAGSKDKVAITTQYFSLCRVKDEEIKRLSHENIEIEIVGHGKKPISLGLLNGNYFKIKIPYEVKPVNLMVNYFGEQRFSKNNSKIGKALIVEKFEEACTLIDNNEIDVHLSSHPKDFIGGLKRMDKKLLALFVHAYQSELWNEVVKSYLKEKYEDAFEVNGFVYLKEKKENVSIPLIAFDTVFQDLLIEKLYNELLKKEGLTLRSFVMRKLSDLMPVSTERDVFVEVKEFNYKESYVEFILSKGSYATVLLEELDARRSLNL